MSIGQRIKQSRRALGLSQSQLAARVGLTQATLSDLENEKSKGTNKVASIAAALKVRPLWLETGRGVPSDDESERDVPQSYNGRITLVIQAAGEGWADLLFKNNGSEFPELDLPEQVFFIKIKGDGYMGRINSGDTLIVDPKLKTQPGDIVYVETIDGRIGLWRLRFNRDSEKCYDAIGKSGESLTLSADDVICESKVYGILTR